MKNDTKEKRATFTQGPWVVSSHVTQIHSEKYGLVTVLEDFTEKSTTQANARLIAAAPELYEQCKLFERAIVELMMQGETGGHEELEKLREVLAKVAGGEG